MISYNTYVPTKCYYSKQTMHKYNNDFVKTKPTKVILDYIIPTSI
jgi:hypothetical protein